MQNYQNHRRLSPIFHFVAYPIITAILLFSFVNAKEHYDRGEDMTEPVTVLLIALVLPLIAFKARGFALRNQDRAIRAEENLRHFALTGKLHDPSLSMKQIIALRFAPDEEFVGLSKRAKVENLSASEIKRSIQNWKADLHRV